jgi:hypothetical protein
MLNTLANHKFLPHDGRNFTLDKVTTALKTALNISEEIGTMLHEFALTTNPKASTWGLDTLSTHNILEHDASLRYVQLSMITSSIPFRHSVTDMVLQQSRRRFLRQRSRLFQRHRLRTNNDLLDGRHDRHPDGC